MRTALLAAVAATFTLGLAAASPASAAVALAAGENDCDLYSANGCLFTHGGGGEFDDPALLVAAYNAAHDATPLPEDLPTLILLGKAEDTQGDGDVTFTDNGNEWIFTDLPWEVSFYTIKAGPDQVLLFGLNPAADDFTATNLVIKNPRGNENLAISHVAFFTTEDGGGGGNEVPEPATWAMMIMGFGGVGSMMRRRRTALA